MPSTVVLVVAILTWAACGHRDGAPPAAGSAGSAEAPGGATAGSAVGGAAGRAGASHATTRPVADSAPEPAPTAEDRTLGVNLALSALGGHVVSPAESADHEWRVSNLLDGFPVIRGLGQIETSLGWRSEAAEAAAAVVIGFRADRVATIAAVVIDTASSANLASSAAVPKAVEILVSTTSATDGFTRVASATLPAAAGETVLRFAPTRATWVKLAIASTHEGAPPQLGEIQIYEAAGGASIVGDLAKNLLLPALGGSLVHFTSQGRDQPAAELVDGKVGDGKNGPEIGWSSSTGPVGSAAHLPQDLTFAFRDHRAAFIDRVVIDPTSGAPYSGPKPNMATWAKVIEVRTSDASPWDGFTTVQTVTLPQLGKPVAIPIGRSIRFLQIRIVENHGGEITTLGEVSAFEGAPPAGRSLLAGRAIPIDRLQAAATLGAETSARREREPNDAPAQADPVTAPTPIGGALSTEADRDVFLVPSAATAGPQTLTVALEGRPAIRTRVTVMDAAFATKFVLDPSRATGTRTRFSVVVPAGNLFLQVLQPPAAQVVIWDTSGSMEHRVQDLDVALHDYLGKVVPSDRVQLIRFDNNVEVLLPGFTGVRAQLVAALKDKVYFDGGTAIYDAIKTGIELLDKVEGSRAIVMMTDGEDTSSAAEPSELWASIDRGRVRVYTIGLGDGLRNYVARAGMTAERMLAEIARSSGGRYTYVARSSDLAGLYAAIGRELRAPATYAIAATSSTATGALSVKAVGDRLAVPPRVELVLDASGSMKRKTGAHTMMAAAKAVLTGVVARVPAEAQVALRVYGHRTPEQRAGACEDTELLVPFGPLDRAQLTAAVTSIRPLGTTPIAYAIQAAGEDLRAAGGPALLILVTDGKEECGGDPVAAATALRASGLDVTLSIIGFGLTDAADRAAMTKVATAGGGGFHDAQDEAGLAAAIDRAMAVPFIVVDAAGAEVGRGTVGADPITVPAGELAIRIASAGTPIVVEHVAVAAGQATRVELRKLGDEVGVSILAPGSTP